MEIVFFVHADFIESQSMPRFAKMLSDGMVQRGHTVQVWSPQPFFYRLSPLKKVRKWMGYIDQFIVFPIKVRKALKQGKKNTIYVFTDHALGPWVPLVAHLPHVIHCHDFLAQRSGLNEIAENKSSWTGRTYQQYIRRGYSTGKNFVSVSQKTRDDLHRFLGFTPGISEMIYNGLNQSFTPVNPQHAASELSKVISIDLSGGYILHVGGNQWYKNRLGVVEIYNAWRESGNGSMLPLLMVGAPPAERLSQEQQLSPFKSDIHFITGLKDEAVRLAYAGATVMLFPSLAEGFGWPIAEAMASGCPVITTNEAPMTEVAGSAGFLIKRRPSDKQSVKQWAVNSASILGDVLQLGVPQREAAVAKCIANAQRFNSDTALNSIEQLYSDILQSYRKS